METNNITHGETKNTSDFHWEPKLHAPQQWEFTKSFNLTRENDQRNEDQAGVQVIVVGQFPNVTVTLKSRLYHIPV